MSQQGCGAVPHCTHALVPPATDMFSLRRELQRAKKTGTKMVSLGFFTISGCRSAPYAELPELVPNAKFFEVPNKTAEACRNCVKLETRCEALLPPWRAECHRLLKGLIVAQTTDSKVQSYLGSTAIPEGSPLAPALAACASLCGEMGLPHGGGYARPHVP